MPYREHAALLPALLFALGLALFQTPAPVSEIAMNMDGSHTADEPADDLHRRGD